MVIFWICLAIAIVVFGVMFWSLIRYRKSKGARAANFHESTLVAILWTAIPVVILIVMAIPATATLKKIYDPSAADLDILITGYQWRWRYEYMDSGVSYFSNLATPETEIRNQDNKNPHYLLQVDEPLVVPVGKKIRFLLTSADVIHAWWVPELAVKKDAVPGFINESWARIDEPGIYRGQCAELCGKNHGFMPIEVRAVPQQAYQCWLQGKQQQQQQELTSSNKAWTAEQLMERGASVYTTYCVACHQAGVPMLPVTHGLAFTRLQVWLYAWVTLATSLLPYVFGLSGLVYLLLISVLNLRWLWLNYAVYQHQGKKLMRASQRAFWFSIRYILYCFLFLLLDHFIAL